MSEQERLVKEIFRLSTQDQDKERGAESEKSKGEEFQYPKPDKKDDGNMIIR